jgi:hypothetical protein
MKKEVLQSIAIVACVIVVAALFAWRYLFSPAMVHRASAPSVSREAADVTPPAQDDQVIADNVPLTTAAAQPAAQPALPSGANMLKNTWFENGLEHWNYWRGGKEHSASLSTVETTVSGTPGKALRIENPYKTLIGLQQLATVEAGGIYRLSGRARSVATNDSKVLFGGRVAIWLPEKREPEIVWMSEYDQWWKRETIFTATVEGAAVVLVHMGYGNVGSTGEFTDIALERLGP